MRGHASDGLFISVLRRKERSGLYDFFCIGFDISYLMVPFTQPRLS